MIESNAGGSKHNLRYLYIYPAGCDDEDQPGHKGRRRVRQLRTLQSMAARRLHRDFIWGSAFFISGVAINLVGMRNSSQGCVPLSSERQ